MNTLRLLVGSFAVALVAWWLGWYEPFHLVTGGTTLALLILAVLLWRRARREEVEVAAAEGTGEGPFRAAFFGLAGGFGICLVLAATFTGAGRIDPLVRLFRDGDRRPFEARLEQLVKAGNHDEAIPVLQRRLEGNRLSRAWRARLVQQLYAQMVEAAGVAGTVQQRTNLLHQALSLAQTNGLDPRLAANLLHREQDRSSTRAKLEQIKAGRHWLELIASLQFVMKDRPRQEWEVPCDQWLYDAHLQWAKDSPTLAVRKEKLLAAAKVAAEYGLDGSGAEVMLAAAKQEESVGTRVQQAAAQAQADAQGEIERLKGGLTEAEAARKRALTEADRNRRHAELAARYQGLVEAGNSLIGPDVQRVLEQRLQLYAQARDFARVNGLDPTVADAAWSKAQSELAALLDRLARDSQPTDLPFGAKGRIVRVAIDRFPPTIDLDLALEDAAGRPIRGLVPKDFRITCGGQGLAQIALAPVARKAGPLHVVMAVDRSGSMAGPALAAAKAGAQALLRGLETEEQVRVEVLAFADTVQTRSRWTPDLQTAATTLAGITAGGETALFAAIQAGLKDLRGCDGDRRLVVFSDGRDTAAGRGFSLAALTTELRAAGVPVYAIGLQTKDLDRHTLQSLATDTGGTYLHAAAPADIAAQFLEARRQLRREFYRLVLTPVANPSAASLDLRITVGGANAAAVNTTVQLASGSYTVMQ